MDQRPAQVSVYGNGGFSLTGLTREEVDLLLGTFRGGLHWVSVDPNLGRLLHVPRHKELPAPATDESMHPFWQPSTETRGVQLELFPLFGEDGQPGHHNSPSFTIQSLCGYNYTPNNYRIQAECLASFGFQCLRSQRDPLTGQFWEIWYLPGAWAASGRLREAIADSGLKDGAEKVRFIVTFLCRNVQFGTLDVAVQRAAMTIRD